MIKKIWALMIINFFLFVHPGSAAQSISDHVVISEIQIAGAAAADEFIEIYNPTQETKDISSWSIQYKSLTGSTFYKKNFADGTLLPAGGFFLIAHKDYVGLLTPDLIHSNFSLASSGNIFLVSSQTTLESDTDPLIIDQFTWEEMDAQISFERKAEENSTSQTMATEGIDAAKGNGFDSNHNENDFVLREIPSPQNFFSTPEIYFETENHGVTENMESTEDTQNHEDTKETENLPTGQAGTENIQTSQVQQAQEGWDAIKLSEVYPNPKNEEDEFIELMNVGGTSVNLEGWKTADTSDSFLLSQEDFPNLMISPGQWFVIPRSVSSLSLNNFEETVFLFSPDGLLRDTLFYEDAPEEKSYAIHNEGLWEWTTKQTPSSSNEFDPFNHAPVASFEIRGTLKEESELMFDASRSFDEDGDTLFFFWNFGDGESCNTSMCKKSYHSYGEHKVTMSLYDARGLKDSLETRLEIEEVKKEDHSKIVLNTEKPKTENIITNSTSVVQTETKKPALLPLGTIIISAFEPNPDGSDVAEWIEIQNKSSDVKVVWFVKTIKVPV